MLCSSLSNSCWGNVRCANLNSSAVTTTQLDIVTVWVGAPGNLHWLTFWFLCSSFSLSEEDLFVDRDLSSNFECSVCSLNSEGSMCSLSALTAVGLAELRECGVWHLGLEESWWNWLLGLDCVGRSWAKLWEGVGNIAWAVERSDVYAWFIEIEVAVVLPVIITIVIMIWSTLHLSKCFSSHLSQAILESRLRGSSDATSEEGD